MSDAKRTPGPWIVDTTKAMGPYNILTNADEVPQADCVICSFDGRHLPGRGPEYRERLEADARLIAAAPMLYEALQALYLTIKGGAYHGDHTQLNAALKALALAEDG